MLRLTDVLVVDALEGGHLGANGEKVRLTIAEFCGRCRQFRALQALEGEGDFAGGCSCGHGCTSLGETKLGAKDLGLKLTPIKKSSRMPILSALNPHSPIHNYSCQLYLHCTSIF